MAFDALGAVVMISGPRDTGEEVTAVREAIAKWNSDHAADEHVVFIPKHYMTDTVPVYTAGVDGQVLINQQVTEQSDVVLCLFKHRLGSPTPRNEHSGTVEEAELRGHTHRVHMYFWDGAIPSTIWRDSANKAELDRLVAFRDRFSDNPLGLYGGFDSTESLKESVTRALTRDAKHLRSQKTRAARTNPITSSFSSFDLQIEGTVWRARENVRELIEALIKIDIREEQEWAAKTAPAPRVSTASTTPAAEHRTPKTEHEIKQWANAARRRLDWFDQQVAAAAGVPLKISAASNLPLEGVEVEIVFHGARGLGQSGKKYSELWTPLQPLRRQPRQFDRRRSTEVASPHGRWVTDGDDVVLNIDFGRLRKRRIPATVNPVILMLSNGSAQRRGVEYSWQATASNTTEEASGRGTLLLMTPTQAEDAIATWTH